MNLNILQIVIVLIGSDEMSKSGGHTERLTGSYSRYEDRHIERGRQKGQVSQTV